MSSQILGYTSLSEVNPPELTDGLRSALSQDDRVNYRYNSFMIVPGAAKEKLLAHIPRIYVVTERESSRLEREIEQRGYLERRYQMTHEAASEDSRPEIQSFAQDAQSQLQAFNRQPMPPRRWWGIRLGSKGYKLPIPLKGNTTSDY